VSIPCKPFEPAADRFATGIHRVRKGRNGKNQANKGGYNWQCPAMFGVCQTQLDVWELLKRHMSAQPFILSCKCNVHASICSTIGPHMPNNTTMSYSQVELSSQMRHKWKQRNGWIQQEHPRISPVLPMIPVVGQKIQPRLKPLIGSSRWMMSELPPG